MNGTSGNPRKIWRLIYDAKMTTAQVAHVLGVTPSYVNVALSRQRRIRGLPALGMPRAFPRPPRKATAAAPPKPARETPIARVEREVAEGKRCPRCWLLLPCDHRQAA